MSRQGYTEAQNVGDPVATIPEFTYKKVSIATGTSKDISGHGCILRGIWVNTTTSQAVTLYDGPGTTNPVLVIPAGITVGPWPCFDIGCRTSLRAVYAGGGTGDITFGFKSF